MIQKIKIKETDDSLEVPGKKLLGLSWVSAPPSPTPPLLIKNLPGEATAFTKLPQFAKCYCNVVTRGGLQEASIPEDLTS